MTFPSAVKDCWFGLCRKAPVLHAVTAMMPGISVVSQSIQPSSGRNTGSPARIRRGISIAAESIRALFREMQLLWFPLLSGFVILFLVLAERWNLVHIDSSSAASGLFSIPFSDPYLIVFDLRLFLIEAVCLSGFTLLLAVLVLFRSARKNDNPIAFRSAFSASLGYAGTLAALSVTMAFAATVLLEIAAQNQVTGTIVSVITRAMFWLPYAYYFTPNGIFTTLFLSFQMMAANTVLFLIALYVVPVIVMENKGLFPALTGSARLMMRTLREILGCALVFGTIVLVVALLGLVIGQSPALLNYDYDFFLRESRGQVLMMVACYGFLLACGVLMALGSTVLGVAVTDLYAYGARAGENTLLAEKGIIPNRVMIR